MCVIRCNVRIRPTQTSHSGVGGWPGHHRTDRESDDTGHGFWGETDDDGNGTGGAEVGSQIHLPLKSYTEGVRSLSLHDSIAEAEYGSTGPQVSNAVVRPDQDGEQDLGSGNQSRWRQDPTSSIRNRRNTPRGCAGIDRGSTAIRRGSPRCDEAVSQCSYIGSVGSSRSPSDSRRQRPEISRLPRRFRVGSNSVERLWCSTPDAHTQQAHQPSRRTVEDVVHFHSAEGHILRPDLATHLGWRNDWAGRPTSLYTTPRSNEWGPRPSRHRRMKNVWDYRQELRILSELHSIAGYCCGPRLEPFGPTKYITHGVVPSIQGQIHAEWFAGGTSCLCDGLAEPW